MVSREKLAHAEMKYLLDIDAMTCAAKDEACAHSFRESFGLDDGQ
jgi:hypothetical protein